MILNSAKANLIKAPDTLTAYLSTDDSIAEPGSTPKKTSIKSTKEDSVTTNNTKTYTFTFENATPENAGMYSSIILFDGDTPFSKLTFAPVVLTSGNKLTFNYTLYY